MQNNVDKNFFVAYFDFILFSMFVFECFEYVVLMTIILAILISSQVC